MRMAIDGSYPQDGVLEIAGMFFIIIMTTGKLLTF
jgi:hypothetical protein